MTLFERSSLKRFPLLIKNWKKVREWRVNTRQKAKVSDMEIIQWFKLKKVPILII